MDRKRLADDQSASSPKGRHAMTGEGWGWELLDKPETLSAPSDESSSAESPAPVARNRYGVPINRRCLNMAAHKLRR
jgi:hypothetical protein